MAEFAETLTFSATSTSGTVSTFGFNATRVRVLNRGASSVFFRTDGTTPTSSAGALLLSSAEVAAEDGLGYVNYKDSLGASVFPTSIGFMTTATSTSSLAQVNIWARG